MFKGLNQICKCKNASDGVIHEGSCEESGLPLNWCESIDGLDEKEVESIKGKILCGKRGGKSFKDA